MGCLLADFYLDYVSFPTDFLGLGCKYKRLNTGSFRAQFRAFQPTLLVTGFRCMWSDAVTTTRTQQPPSLSQLAILNLSKPMMSQFLRIVHSP